MLRTGVESLPGKAVTQGDVRSACVRIRKAGAAARPSRRVATLGHDLQEAAVTRVGLLALLVAIFSVVLRLVVPQGAGATPAILGLRLGAFASTVAISLSLAALAWRRALPARTLLNLALFYEVVQALLFGITFHAVSADSNIAPRGWSTVAVWILTFPLIVPATRAKTIAATLLAGLMDPLGLALAVAAGSPEPSRSVAGSIFLRTGLAIIASLLVSRLLHRMSAEAADAREMGAYRLIEPIGRGGMGEVWRAEHRMLIRPAALKLVRPEALASNGWSLDEAIARFEREARATAALRSPHTVAVYDFGAAEDGSLYYVMELLDGFDADTLVRRFGPLPPERVVHLLRHACHSLEEAHRAGMIHRDIKPANILVCRHGLDLDFVKIVDFGLVKGSRDSIESEGRVTSARAIAGTPDYMSPETVLGEHTVDWRSDIYSLGCVAYWMLTGETVFDSGSPLKVAFDHAETPPVPPSRRTDRVIPKALEEIVLECLSKDPRQRPQTASELGLRLAELGIEERWSRRDAEIWWRDHAPDRLPGPAALADAARLSRKTA